MRVTPDLNLLNSTLICPRDTLQRNPAVVFNEENHVVVWSDLNFDQTNYYIAAARVDTLGVVIDTGICITNGSGESENFPRIAYDGNRSLVVWAKAGSIYGRFLNSSCQPEGAIFPVTSQSNGAPVLSFDGTNYLILWPYVTGPNHSIEGQFVSPAGNLIGSSFIIANDTTPLVTPDIIFDGMNYFVVWCEPWASDPLVRGQFVDVSGGLIGSSFAISDEGTNFRREDPVIAASDSNYLVAWDEYRASLTSDLYGNVDVVSLGVKSENERDIKDHPWTGTTIYSGPIQLPENKTCRVFDITGRVIMPEHVKRGIYFIELDGRVIQKIVKIK